jgi:hypothetical protein
VLVHGSPAPNAAHPGDQATGPEAGGTAEVRAPRTPTLIE